MRCPPRRRRNAPEAEGAFAAMSVALDRYLKAGDLYDAYDPITSTEKFFAGTDDSALVFVPPTRDPPKVRFAGAVVCTAVRSVIVQRSA
jgi:hypothetical protein